MLPSLWLLDNPYASSEPQQINHQHQCIPHYLWTGYVTKGRLTAQHNHSHLPCSSTLTTTSGFRTPMMLCSCAPRGRGLSSQQTQALAVRRPNICWLTMPHLPLAICVGRSRSKAYAERGHRRSRGSAACWKIKRLLVIRVTNLLVYLLMSSVSRASWKMCGACHIHGISVGGPHGTG